MVVGPGRTPGAGVAATATFLSRFRADSAYGKLENKLYYKLANRRCRDSDAQGWPCLVKGDMTRQFVSLEIVKVMIQTFLLDG